ncbi:F-box protein SKIP14 [Abeliophyllum distichum]|uniref:F-box protein SKIP14 n=1 Tax=Abeliophyllum distichum TaxID=126358 RepID=A0ABD1V4N7_9LAMI
MIQEGNLSSGIKFDNECFLETCQNTEREILKGSDDSKIEKVYEDIDDLFHGDSFGILPNDPFGMYINFPWDSFCMDCIATLDASLSSMPWIEAFDTETCGCGFETEETPEDMKADDNKMGESVGSMLGSQYWSYDGCYPLRSVDVAHERKGLEKDCTNTSLPTDPLFMYTNLPNEPFGMDFTIGANDSSSTGWIKYIRSKSHGIETEETLEAKKAGDNKIAASMCSVLGSEDVSFDDQYAMGGYIENHIQFDKYWFPDCEWKGLEKDCIRTENDGTPPHGLFCKLLHDGVDMEDSLPFGFDKYWLCSCDLAHMRKGPSEPFGMDFTVGANVASVTSWIDDTGSTSYGIKTDQETFEAKKADEMVASIGSVLGSENESFYDHYALGGHIEDYIQLSSDKYWFPKCDSSLELKGLENDCIRAENDGTPPHALHDEVQIDYIKLLHDEVQNDPLLWRNIHVGHPLNDMITDDDLLKLTNRAQGTLHSLSLVGVHKHHCYWFLQCCLERTITLNQEESDEQLKESSPLYAESENLNGPVYEDIAALLLTDPFHMKIDLNLPYDDDSESETVYKDAAEFFTDDPFGMGISTSSPVDFSDPFDIDC